MSDEKVNYNFFVEHRRKSKAKRKLRHVSSEQSYRDDLKKFKRRTAVIDEIKKITNHLKNKNDKYLAIYHYDHKLDGRLAGFRSLSLYPGEYGDKDILIIYKIHKNDHVVFYRIGNHEYVYSKK